MPTSTPAFDGAAAYKHIALDVDALLITGIAEDGLGKIILRAAWSLIDQEPHDLHCRKRHIGLHASR